MLTFLKGNNVPGKPVEALNYMVRIIQTLLTCSTVSTLRFKLR